MKQRVQQHPCQPVYQVKANRPETCDVNPRRCALGSATPSPLRGVMRATEYFPLAFGCIIGVGWLVVIDEWLQAGGPLGAMLAFLVCGLALVPIALVYGRLAGRMPEAASEIAYT